MLDLADKDLKATIKNMFLTFKKLKFKELMENIVVTTQQKRNLNTICRKRTKQKFQSLKILESTGMKNSLDGLSSEKKDSVNLKIIRNTPIQGIGRQIEEK